MELVHSGYGVGETFVHCIPESMYHVACGHIYSIRIAFLLLETSQETFHCCLVFSLRDKENPGFGHGSSSSFLVNDYFRMGNEDSYVVVPLVAVFVDAYTVYVREVLELQSLLYMVLQDPPDLRIVFTDLPCRS